MSSFIFKYSPCPLILHDAQLTWWFLLYVPAYTSFWQAPTHSTPTMLKWHKSRFIIWDEAHTSMLVCARITCFNLRPACVFLFWDEHSLPVTFTARNFIWGSTLRPSADILFRACLPCTTYEGFKTRAIYSCGEVWCSDNCHRMLPCWSCSPPSSVVYLLHLHLIIIS